MDIFQKQEQLKPYFANAYGYAVFPHIAKGGIGIGGAGGGGEVYVSNKDGTFRKVGESKMIQISFGFQFGGQVYSEIIFFESEKDFKNFTDGNFEFGADANAVVLTASAGAKATSMGNHFGARVTADKHHMKDQKGKYTKGMAVFSVALGGLMYQATLGGQKFKYNPIQN